MVDEKIRRAQIALEEIKDYTQEQADAMVKACGRVIYEHAEELAVEAVSETQYGNVEFKTAKNRNSPASIWTYLKDKKSVGVIARDEAGEEGIIKIAHPVGVVGSVTPVTVPNVCPTGNTMLALKGKNAIIVAPSPKSKLSSTHTVNLMRAELEKLGAPADLIQIVEEPTLELTRELMSKCDVVVATGGPGLVSAAYASGTPAYGVGAGNSQVIVDDVTDYPQFAKDTVASRSFDNGTSCLATQTYIYRRELKREVEKALTDCGVHIIEDAELVSKLRGFLFPSGIFNKEMAGQGAQIIAKRAGIKVPGDTVVIALKLQKYGHEEILCHERPCAVLGAYEVDTFEGALDIACANYDVDGKGHTAGIYTMSENHAIQAGIRLPVSRLMVNQPTRDGGGSPTNNLVPTNTIGCGSWGNNSISENLSYKHLLNIQRVVYSVKKAPVDMERIWD